MKQLHTNNDPTDLYPKASSSDQKWRWNVAVHGYFPAARTNSTHCIQSRWGSFKQSFCVPKSPAFTYGLGWSCKSLSLFSTAYIKDLLDKRNKIDSMLADIPCMLTQPYLFQRPSHSPIVILSVGNKVPLPAEITFSPTQNFLHGSARVVIYINLTLYKEGWNGHNVLSYSFGQHSTAYSTLTMANLSVYYTGRYYHHTSNDGNGNFKTGNGILYSKSCNMEELMQVSY